MARACLAWWQVGHTVEPGERCRLRERALNLAKRLIALCTRSALVAVARYAKIFSKKLSSSPRVYGYAAERFRATIRRENIGMISAIGFGWLNR